MLTEEMKTMTWNTGFNTRKSSGKTDYKFVTATIGNRPDGRFTITDRGDGKITLDDKETLLKLAAAIIEFTEED